LKISSKRTTLNQERTLIYDYHAKRPTCQLNPLFQRPGSWGALRHRRRVGPGPFPTSTATWYPVPYKTLVDVAKEILGNGLPGHYELVDEAFILAQHDQQFFGALTYKSAEFNLPFAVGLRGSSLSRGAVNYAAHSVHSKLKLGWRTVTPYGVRNA
jgi:hypothetical protein